jgi:hypothetical protein
MIPKLSTACYAGRSVFDISMSIYFAYFNSVMKYGIIIWGYSSISKRIFTLQKRIVIIMADAKPKNSYRIVLMTSEMLPLLLV